MSGGYFGDWYRIPRVLRPTGVRRVLLERNAPFKVPEKPEKPEEVSTPGEEEGFRLVAARYQIAYTLHSGMPYEINLTCYVDEGPPEDKLASLVASLFRFGDPGPVSIKLLTEGHGWTHTESR